MPQVDAVTRLFDFVDVVQKIVVSDRTGSHDGLAFVAIEHHGQYIARALNGEGQLLASLHGCPRGKKAAGDWNIGHRAGTCDGALCSLNFQ